MINKIPATELKKAQKDADSGIWTQEEDDYIHELKFKNRVDMGVILKLNIFPNKTTQQLRNKYYKLEKKK